jgi:tetratricopeptide (TPR) repeat protein
MSQNLTVGSAFARRRRLHALIREGNVGRAVLDELLPHGKPLNLEREMWDYKSKLPPYPALPSQNEAEKVAHAFDVAGLIKDVVSFYNSYGGYLVIGIGDVPREIIGCNAEFDCDKFNRQVEGSAKHHIECMFNLHQVVTDHTTKTIGLLFIPQRPESVVPKHLVKPPPKNAAGKPAYLKDAVYLRRADECRPASTIEDYMFLCAQGRRQLVDEPRNFSSALSNNLRERDPGFIKFIGREEHLRKLWEWLSDNYSAGKLLAGGGGVGKTTIVREFAEDVVRLPPHGIERVIWFSAKARYYLAVSGESLAASRVDFKDTDSLLKSILPELGCPVSQIDAEWSRFDLMNEVIESLKVIPALVIVDDVDSLTVEEQNDVLHTMLQIMERTFHGAGASSRVIFTGRLNLGVPRSQYIEVLGMNFDEFAEYVEMTATQIGLTWNVLRNSKLFKNFHKVSAGSPAFASSILRLVKYGVSLSDALRRWEGADGEEVRSFAFERELDRLTDSQHRTLYALCILGDTTQLELQQVTESTETLLRDDLSVLSSYHVVATTGITAKGGSRLRLPSWIQLMKEEVSNRITYPKTIERACARVRQHSPRAGEEVGNQINAVLALWRADLFDDALESAKQICNQHPKNPDIRCLLGRAYLKIRPPDSNNADAALRKAHDLNCQRVELFDLWIEAKRLRRDWIGILEITESKEINLPVAERFLARVDAYSHLGDHARKSMDPDLAQEYFLKGGQEANQALLVTQGLGYREELTKSRYLHFQSYVDLVSSSAKDDDNNLVVWTAVLLASKHNVYAPALVMTGADRLYRWGRAIMKQQVVSASKVATLGRQSDQLGKLIDKITTEYPMNADQRQTVKRLEEIRIFLSDSFEGLKQEAQLERSEFS